MSTWKNFRRARSCLLREDGGTVAFDGSEADPAGARLLVLSRALCRFSFYRQPPGLAGSQAVQAVRLHAEAHAPFAEAGSLIIRGGNGFGIWWWDADRVKALLGDRWRYDPDALMPETILHPPGEGWRQVRTLEGYEGQFWRDGALVASTWRRRPLTQQDWFSFGLEADGGSQPTAVPAPVVLPLRPANSVWRFSAPPGGWGWEETTRWANRAAVAGLAVAAFFAGQAWHHDSRRDADIQATRMALAAERADPSRRQAAANLDLVRAFNARMPRSGGMAAAADAFEILRRFGLEVSAWSVDEQRFSARLVLPDRQFSLGELAMALEASSSLHNVAPQIDAERMTITILADLESAVRPTREAAR